jgi:hypothetical protein
MIIHSVVQQWGIAILFYLFCFGFSKVGIKRSYKVFICSGPYQLSLPRFLFSLKISVKIAVGSKIVCKCIEQVEAQHRKYKKLTLGCG